MKQGSQEAAGGAVVCGVQSPQCEVQPHPLPELCIDEPTACGDVWGHTLGPEARGSVRQQGTGRPIRSRPLGPGSWGRKVMTAGMK